MSSTYHNRVINIFYNEDKLPTFKTDEELNEWHRALGRLVAYGLQREAEADTVQLVEITALYHAEMTAIYSRPMAALNVYPNGYTRYLGSPSAALHDYVADCRSREEGRPFVLGAVLHGDKWGFHS